MHRKVEPRRGRPRRSRAPDHPARPRKIDDPAIDRLRTELEAHVAEVELQGEELRRSHAALQAALGEYTRLFDFTPVGCFVVDRDGCVRSVNGAGSKLVGIERRRLVGLRLGAHVRAGDLARFHELVAAVTGTPGEAVRGPIDVALRRSGEVRDVRLSAARLPGLETERPTALLVAEDVTEWKRAEAERRAAEARNEYLARFPEENPDPVIRLDADLAVAYANDAARSVLGPELAAGDRAPGPLLEHAREAVERGTPVLAELRIGGAFFSFRFAPAGGEVNVYAHDVTERHHVEEALRLSEARARSVASSVRDLVVVTEAVRGPDGEIVDWRYVEANEAALERFGKTRDEVVGRALRTAWPERAAELSERMARVAATGAAEQYDASAGDRTYLVRIFRIDGDLVGTAAVDMTHRKHAEDVMRASEQRLRGLADSIPHLAWTARPDGYITWFNRRWYEYTGTTLAQMEGWGWQGVHDPATLPMVLERWRASVELGRPFEMELPLRGADGRFRPFLTRAYPLKDEAGNVLQWFGTNTDVTELVEVREALESANARLKEADRRKDDFLGMLSHELRNPLAPIRNAAYILERADPSGEQAERARGVLRRQTEHLTRLVDDLLDVTRITRGKIALQRSRVDLRDAIVRAAEDIRPKMAERGVAFRTELPRAELWAHADPTRVNQVVANLLNNASKFTRRGDEVVVSLSEEGGVAEIRVRDTGAGIDAAVLPHIFDAFVQADRTLARSEGGLGLGLALVKSIVELHGGEVRAASEGVGKGTEITVRLPLQAGAAAAPRAGNGAAAIAAGGLRVLVVDDNRDAAESLAELLRMLGHEVDVAYDGSAALAALDRSQPDAILCDIGLPGMDGYQVARAIRANGGRGVRLVALSGYAQADDVQRALAAGFDAHVPKPPDPQQLARLLS